MTTTTITDGTTSGPVTINDNDDLIVTDTGTINTTGAGYAVQGEGSIGTLSNAGLIEGSGGIESVGGIADIENLGGTIDGTDNYAIDAGGALGTVTNSGAIDGNGIFVGSGDLGTLTNETGGVIDSGNQAVHVDSGTLDALTNDGTISSQGSAISGTALGTITNTGSITSIQGFAITGGVIADVDNKSGGTIVGSYFGLYAPTIQSLSNAGDISATGGGDAVLANEIDTLINSGTISSAQTAVRINSMLGTLKNSGLIQSTSNNAIYDNGGGSIVNTGTIAGGLSITNVDSTIENAGTITGLSGGDAINLTIGTYTVILDPTSSITGNVSDSNNNGTLELSGTNANTVSGIGTQYTGFNTIVFNDAYATASGTTAGLNRDTISGFVVGDTIEVTDLSAVSGPVTANSNGVLSLDDGSFTLNFGTAGANHLFNLASDGSSGISLGIACYLRGTRILSDRGEVPVEALAIGDPLVTVSGEARPIRWIGTRKYAARFAARNREIWPVRIAAGALGEGVPKRDLFVSPQHAMFLDGVLIPAIALTNGASISQTEPTAVVEYFHLELDTHDVIMAEGAAAETFVDDDSRGMFQNAAEFHARYPGTPREPARFCAPRVEDGEELEAIRRRIAAPKGSQEAVASRLSGLLEVAERGRIAGWAWDPGAPATPLTLRILDNEVAIAEVVADAYRGDLEHTGIGDGRHSFELIVPGGLAPDIAHVIRVLLPDGRDVFRSPATLAASEMTERPALTQVVPNLAAAKLRGNLELVTHERMHGWAWDPSDPDQPVSIQVLANGEVVGWALANRYRKDLANAGIGDGRHAFAVTIPGGLSPSARQTIQVRRVSDGAEIPRSPRVLEAAGGFDAGLEQTVARAVAAVPAEEADRVASFLVAQTDLLLRQRAAAEGQHEARQTHRSFRRRWGSSLPPDGAVPPGAVDPGLRVLVVDDRLPDAARDAGSRAILSHMRGLQSLGYAVSFVAANDFGRDGAAVVALEAEGIACCRAPLYGSVEDVLRRQAQCFDAIYLHRVSNASRYLALARGYLPRARILYSVADLHHVRMARQASAEQRPELLSESQRLRVAECIAAWSADAVLTHSDWEAAALRQAVPTANVHVVPWGVTPRPTVTPFARRNGVAFVGGFGHPPNVDAAIWLVDEIMPLVWRRDPSIACVLVGSDMPDSVRRLAGPGVRAVGAVADLATVFEQVRLTVAPLRYGAGVKGKVLESIAAGVPCVMSPVAAEGVAWPAPLAGAVGGSATALAEQIVCLHGDAAAWADAAEAGLALIRERFDEGSVVAALRTAIEGSGSPVAMPGRLGAAQ